MIAQLPRDRPRMNIQTRRSPAFVRVIGRHSMGLASALDRAFVCNKKEYLGTLINPIARTWPPVPVHVVQLREQFTNAYIYINRRHGGRCKVAASRAINER